MSLNMNERFKRKSSVRSNAKVCLILLISVPRITTINTFLFSVLIPVAIMSRIVLLIVDSTAYLLDRFAKQRRTNKAPRQIDPETSSFDGPEGVDKLTIIETGPNAPNIIIVPTPPLTDEEWEAIEQPVAFQLGRVGHMLCLKHGYPRKNSVFWDFKIPLLTVPPAQVKRKQRELQVREEKARAQRRYMFELATNTPVGRLDADTRKSCRRVAADVPFAVVEERRILAVEEQRLVRTGLRDQHAHRYHMRRFLNAIRRQWR
jgi:hypothetical protein